MSQHQSQDEPPAGAEQEGRTGEGASSLMPHLTQFHKRPRATPGDDNSDAPDGDEVQSQ